VWDKEDGGFALAFLMKKGEIIINKKKLLIKEKIQKKNYKFLT